MLKGLYKQFGTNKTLEQNGVEIKYNADGANIVFVTRCPGGANSEWNKAREKYSAAFKNDITAGRLSEDDAQYILKQAFVDACLIGWSGVTDENGNELSYTPQNALKLFLDLPRLFTDLYSRANDIANYQDGTLGDEAKN